jgi:putative flippase GtrA
MRRRIDAASIFRYSFVGAGGTALHYILLVAAVELLFVPAPIAAVLGASAGALFNYLLNFHITFASRRAHRDAAPRFLAVALFGALINGVIVLLGASFGVHYVVSQIAATALVLLIGYVLNSLWTY